MSFSSKVLSIFQRVRSTPSLLRQSLPQMKGKLHSQGNILSQGTGNQPTDQEASFAQVAEEEGFQFHENKAGPPSPGLYYLYQVNGSQQSIDFQLFEMGETEKIRHINLDLKHTTNDVFFLNDGWFYPDVVYLVTWERRTSEARKKKVTELQTFLALGQDIPTTEESAMMAQMNQLKKTYNNETKGVGSLCAYIRFANRYKCDRFTPEYTESCFQKVARIVT